MRPLFRSSSALRIAVAAVLVIVVPLCQAQSPSPSLDRHARKVQKILAACPLGGHVHLILHDQSDLFGYLGNLSPGSFELLDPQTRAPRTLAYDQVERVDCEGRTWGGAYHHRGSTGFLIIIGVAVAVGVGIIAATRN